jgi:hypothetical protein
MRQGMMVGAVLLAGLVAVGDAAAYKATLTVQGGVSVKRATDTMSECSPGQAWTLNVGTEINAKANVTVTAFERMVTAYSPKEVQKATHDTKISGYAETNFCAPIEPIELDEPVCKGFTLPGVNVGMSTAGTKRKLYLDVGAGVRTPQEMGANCATPRMQTADPNVKLSLLQWGGAALKLPLDLRNHSAVTLGHGKKLIRRLRLVGPCDAVRITHGKAVVAPFNPLEDGDCVVDGTLNVELKRR